MGAYRSWVALFAVATALMMSCGGDDTQAPTGCTVDLDCKGAQAGRVCVSSACVACNVDADCRSYAPDGGTAVCSAGVCKGCAAGDASCAPQSSCDADAGSGVGKQ